MGLELTTYNITFKWISGACNKAADYLSRLVNYHMIGKPQFRCSLPPIMMVQHFIPGAELHNPTYQKISLHNLRQILSHQILPQSQTHQMSMPKPLTEDRLHALLQMQRTDPFCKHISKCLSNRKAPKYEADLFLHIKGLLYKHVTDSNQKFLALVIPKAWKYTVLMEAHDKLGHQGATCIYCLIKCQYYWKGMNKDIRKYIANCTLCCREKAKVQSYPLQMTQILKWPFDKITIDLETECKTSTSGNKHILTIIDCHLTGWPEAFPILRQVSRYHSIHIHSVTTFQFTCALGTILSDNGTELKNQLMDQVLQQLGIGLHLLCIIPSSKQWKTRSLS